MSFEKQIYVKVTTTLICTVGGRHRSNGNVNSRQFVPFENNFIRTNDNRHARQSLGRNMLANPLFKLFRTAYDHVEN